MRIEADVPAWMIERLSDRATALGVTFDVALEMSLDMDRDRQANVLGWARAQGASPADIARRSHYSRRTVEEAHRRWLASRLPNVGGTP